MGIGRLRHRIAAQPGNMDAHMASHRLPGQGVPPQEMTMPLSVVEMSADVISVEEATPLYAARGGAPVAATGTGEWDQIRAAGRA